MISSTWIRERVLQGDVQAAERLMGRPFALLAEVCHGAQLGRRLGFPTINQRFPALKLIPHPGVYATRLEIDGTSYIGATSVGTRPTVNGEDLRAETHILGYEGDLYGRFLKLEFLRYLREELRFASLDDLSAQLRLDARRAAEAAAAQSVLGRDA